MKKKIGIVTLGCKVNQYESEAFAEALEDLGYEICDASEACDAYIVNTCTVTAEADRKSKQMIRRAARANKKAAPGRIPRRLDWSAQNWIIRKSSSGRR